MYSKKEAANGTLPSRKGKLSRIEKKLLILPCVKMGRKLGKRKQTDDEVDVNIKREKTSVHDSQKDECSLEKGHSMKTNEDALANNCRKDNAKDNDLNAETVATTTEPKTKDNKNTENDKNDNSLDATNKDVEDIMKEVSVNKKKKKKEKNKKTKPCVTADSEKTETEDNKKSSKELAIAYLKLWKKNREEWKFQKVRQVWLLSNMLDSEMVKGKHFETLLLYLDGLKGKARETTSTAAQNIIESESDSGVKVDRARQIVQQLSTE
ncbi:unnamed protein product [Mytilus edulis]|uniref:WKF domain-containing protein n=1 Tax=Mytilus edulis TaxID=6550 RepID=A0A8S3PUV9_MYTED|nr:unnamed protein product [Mytilus edulis]